MDVLGIYYYDGCILDAHDIKHHKSYYLPVSHILHDSLLHRSVLVAQHLDGSFKSQSIFYTDFSAGNGAVYVTDV